jgi:nanoRNase/pAp phosphatase (c-di-AMP/oligoRNAs hydrolase)
MRCLAVCHTELVARLLQQVLPPRFDVDFLVESRPLARRLHDLGLNVAAGDIQKAECYIKSEVGPATCVVVEDNGRQSLRHQLDAIWNAGTTLVYVFSDPRADASRTLARRNEQLRAAHPELSFLTMAELLGPALVTEVSRSLTRARVQQYQRYFSDADRVLILLHNDPDPDAMASGLALRTLLRRTKSTAILGALQGVTRPENLRMVNLLDIQVEVLTSQAIQDFSRVAMVDVQPHYFGGLIDRVDLVIDHHPPQSGYSSVFRDIRQDYGSTCTILTEHLRAVDVNISERTATAMLYAIKSDTLFFNRQANTVDLEAFSFLYPLADAAMIRKMEGAEITMERLEYVTKAQQTGVLGEQVFCAFLGTLAREDFIPYVADFFLQLEDVKWTIVAGVVNNTLIVSVRNLGYTRHAGELVRRVFGELGSAGGHRAMAKAVVPLRAFQEKYGPVPAGDIGAAIQRLALDFLHEGAPEKKKPSGTA